MDVMDMRKCALRKCALLALGIFALGALSAGSAFAKEITRPGAEGDFLVTVGKRTTWVSQVAATGTGGVTLRMQVIALVPVDTTRGGVGDYLTWAGAGKRPVWASIIPPRPVATYVSEAAAPSYDSIVGHGRLRHAR